MSTSKRYSTAKRAALEMLGDAWRRPYKPQESCSIPVGATRSVQHPSLASSAMGPCFTSLCVAQPAAKKSGSAGFQPASSSSSISLLASILILTSFASPIRAQGPGPGPAPGPSPGPSTSANNSTAAILRRGTQLIDAGRLQEALSVFQEYCSNRPGDARAYFWMGVCYDEMGNFLAATQAYHDGITKAEQNGMDSSEIRMNLGNVLLKQNQTDLAIEAYKRALEVNPAYGLAELNLGRAYIAKGDFNSALKSFDKCAELRFNARQLPYYRAKALLGLGRTDEAGVTVQRLLQDFPEGTAKSDIQREFESCLKPQK